MPVRAGDFNSKRQVRHFGGFLSRVCNLYVYINHKTNYEKYTYKAGTGANINLL